MRRHILIGKALEKRVSQLEKRMEEYAKKQLVCNCRVKTCYHSGHCLDAILKGVSRVCPVHGFREAWLFLLDFRTIPS
jgi:hypothetical protein